MNLLLFRAGPQDFPFDPKLTGVLVPITVLVSYVVQMLVYPPLVAAAMALAVVMGLALAVKLVLHFRKLGTRFLQTYHSLLVVNAVTTLLLWPAMSALAPALRKMAAHPKGMEAGAELDIAAGPATLVLVVAIWNFAVSANVFGHATGVGPGRGAAIALMVALGMQMFVLFFSAMAAALVGMPASG
ncbi:MAG: hypothetical protein ACT4P0_05610 [Panacagrimonas sp.]